MSVVEMIVGPPYEMLCDATKVGDVITQVNDVKEIDTAMVAECQQKAWCY